MILNKDDLNGIQRFILNHYFESDIITIDTFISSLCEDDADLLILRNSINKLNTLGNMSLYLDMNSHVMFVFISNYIKHIHLEKNNLVINDYSANTLKRLFDPYNKIICYYYSILNKILIELDKKIKK